MRVNNILLRYAEVGLKGRNRAAIERVLADNVRARLADLGLQWRVDRARSYLFVRVSREADHAQVQVAVQALQQVSGLVWIVPALRLPGRTQRNGQAPVSEQELAETLARFAEARFRPDSSFRVTVKRADKRHPGDSTALQQSLGRHLLESTRWRTVSLTAADRDFHVEIYPESVYFHVNRFPGIGGLPVGVSGRTLVLLSGGIDSPVAAYLMARRGCAVDFVHFSATALQQEQAAAGKMGRLAAAISRYTGHSRLVVLPYTPFELAMLTAQTRYELIVFRRFMATTAERLAADTGAQALVTGDSLGQVASQTMENLVSLSRAVAMPVLRPLLAWDKQEIVALARRIGTFELSVEAYKDCCALLSHSPKTLSYHERLTGIEQRELPDYGAVVDETLAGRVQLEYRLGRRVE